MVTYIILCDMMEKTNIVPSQRMVEVAPAHEAV